MYALRADGTVRAHGVTGRGRCPGSYQPPRVVAVPAPVPSAPVRPLPPEVAACDHLWSGWTHLPRTRDDFRRCEHCRHVELQPRQPCALCGDEDARALEVPDYGTAYVCMPCLSDV
ncbi:hypothetical protein AWB94_04945 [Mycolicibacterium canariasense]|nr:hypothetical protein AWB94_04945 [Mycolicibacterium canariasense]